MVPNATVALAGPGASAAKAQDTMARVLLVDDEKMAQTVYGDYLTRAGHECAWSAACARPRRRSSPRPSTRW